MGSVAVSVTEAIPEPATSADCRLPDVRTDNQETPTAWSLPSEEEEAQSQKRRHSQEPVSEQSRPPTASLLSPSQAAEIQLTATQALELLQPWPAGSDSRPWPVPNFRVGPGPWPSLIGSQLPPWAETIRCPRFRKHRSPRTQLDLQPPVLSPISGQLGPELDGRHTGLGLGRLATSTQKPQTSEAVGQAGKLSSVERWLAHQQDDRPPTTRGSHRGDTAVAAAGAQNRPASHSPPSAAASTRQTLTQQTTKTQTSHWFPDLGSFEREGRRDAPSSPSASSRTSLVYSDVYNPDQRLLTLDAGQAEVMDENRPPLQLVRQSYWRPNPNSAFRPVAPGSARAQRDAAAPRTHAHVEALGSRSRASHSRDSVFPVRTPTDLHHSSVSHTSRRSRRTTASSGVSAAWLQDFVLRQQDIQLRQVNVAEEERQLQQKFASEQRAQQLQRQAEQEKTAAEERRQQQQLAADERRLQLQLAAEERKFQLQLQADKEKRRLTKDKLAVDERQSGHRHRAEERQELIDIHLRNEEKLREDLQTLRAAEQRAAQL